MQKEPPQDKEAKPEKQPSPPKDTPQPKPTERTAPKREKSNLFSSFAKAKPKQKKEGSATPASGVESVGFLIHRCSILTLNRPSLVALKMVSLKLGHGH